MMPLKMSAGSSAKRLFASDLYDNTYGYGFIYPDVEHMCNFFGVMSH